VTDTLHISGDNLRVTDSAGNVVYPPGTPVPPDPPTEKPKLAITTPNGNAQTNTNVTIAGTIDLPNVGCDILLDAGPTSFGTFRAGADGHWSKVIQMTTTGMWTITAHATNSVGKTDSNSVVMQVSQGGVDPGPDPGTDAPPEPAARIAAGASFDTIQAAVNDTTKKSVVLAAGTYNFNGRSIRLRNGAVVWADGAVTINGAPGPGSTGAFDGGGLSDWVVTGKAPGQGFMLTSMVNATSAQRFVVGNAKFTNLPSNGYDGSCVRFGSARGGTVVNCDFVNCQGNNLGMYSHSDIVVDGCHFDGCRQPLSYQFSTDGSNGNNIGVFRGVFERMTRAAMEMGPDANKKQKMNGLKVNGNWFDDFNPDQQTCDQGASLPISLVATASANSECKDNYIRRGDRPMAVNRPHPAIEFSGSLHCMNNTIDSYAWEGFMYGSGYNYHDNKAFNAPWKCVVGTGGGAGTIVPSQILSSAPPKPPKPTRVATSIYYPWSKAAATTTATAAVEEHKAPTARPQRESAESLEAHEDWKKRRRYFPFSGDDNDPEGKSEHNKRKREHAEREHKHA
jgi:hypothetical protein